MDKPGFSQSMMEKGVFCENIVWFGREDSEEGACRRIGVLVAIGGKKAQGIKVWKGKWWLAGTLGRSQGWEGDSTGILSKWNTHWGCFSAAGAEVPDGVRDSEHMPENVLVSQVPKWTWEGVSMCLLIHSWLLEQKIALLCFQNPHLDLVSSYFWEEPAAVWVDSAL